MTLDLERIVDKSAAYGSPIRIEIEIDGNERTLVLHGATANAPGAPSGTLSLLDASRASAGNAADDVACMSELAEGVFP